MNNSFNIPKQFELARHVIKVNIVESLPDDEYGNFSDQELLINIATTVKGHKLQDIQIHNTFWHEWKHAYQFFYNNKFDEIEAQTFANLMCEYELTKSYEPIPF